MTQRHPSMNPAAAVLGIVGGGQLGRMLVLAAEELGVECVALDPEPDSPAVRAGARGICASLFDADALQRLVEGASVTTFEIEATDADVLQRLEDRGHRILPRPVTLKLIQDKLSQKQFLQAHGIATSDFRAMDAPAAEAVRSFGLPAVQKLRRGGYDGRGVKILHREGDLDELLDGPSLIEAFVPAARELAMVGARAVTGEIRCYDVVDMTLNPVTNMLDMLTVPADIPGQVAREARELARRTIEALDDIGVFAVELFMNGDGTLYVNEVSPRTHNSGHYTIDACETSQFEQHIRAVTGMPLGDTALHRPAAMINLVGAAGFSGPTVVEGEEEVLGIDGVHLHLYGKRECRPGRKMGHVTVVADSIADAVTGANRVRQRLVIRGRDPLPAAVAVSS